MNLIIDTNIVFSAILNPNSNIVDLSLNYQDKVKFYDPEFLLTEIEKYSDKIEKYSKQSSTDLVITKILVLSAITFFSEDLFSQENWINDTKLLKKNIRISST